LKISHELKIVVHPKRTALEALGIGEQKTALKKFADTTLEPRKKEKLLELMGKQVLSREDETEYEKTVALASLERSLLACEIYKELKELDFYPAGLSETISYLDEAKDVPVSSIIVLGMRLLDDECKEIRLVIKENSFELETMYPRKPIKQHFQIVVVKEEKSARKK